MQMTSLRERLRDPAFWRRHGERFPRAYRTLLLSYQLLRSALKHNVLEFAMALAYTAFFSLVPMLALLGLVLGALMRSTQLEALIEPVLEQAPEATRVVVVAGLNQLADTDLRVAPLMLVGFLWVASSGAHGAMDILELVLGASPRPWLRKRLLALAWVVGVLLTVGVTLGVLVKATTRVEEEAVQVLAAEHEENQAAPGEEHAAGSSGLWGGFPARHVGVEQLPAMLDPSRGVPMLRRRLVLVGSALSGSVTAIVLLLLGFLALAGFYRTGISYDDDGAPTSARARRRIYPGALLALLGCFAVSSAFGLYVARFGRYVTYYGGLATVAVLLLWLQLTALAFLLGAELNAVLEGRRENAPPSLRERHAAEARGERRRALQAERAAADDAEA